MNTIIGMIPNHPMVFPLLFAILVILMFIPLVVLVYSKNNNKNYKLFVIISLVAFCYGYFLYEIRDYAFKHPTTSVKSTTYTGKYKDIIRCESEFCTIRHIEILTVYPFGYSSKFSEKYIIESEDYIIE